MTQLKTNNQTIAIVINNIAENIKCLDGIKTINGVFKVSFDKLRFYIYNITEDKTIVSSVNKNITREKDDSDFSYCRDNNKNR